VHLRDVPTPALVVDLDAFEHNVRTMSAAHPGARLRPHVKAFKSTALAAELAAAGHRGFCAATPKEILGLAAAGLGDDLLLANQSIDPTRLRAMADCGARVTIAVDSDATVDAAAANGIREVLVDVDVGMPRCGAPVTEVARIADRARAKGMEVRGVMGYEGHLMMEPGETKADKVEQSMRRLLEAHAATGGDVVSGGGTGTYAVNRWVNEIQAGSYTLMDTEYAKLDTPFRQALFVWATVISANPGGWRAADAGLKALGMDHGNPTVDDFDLWYCADEHTVFSEPEGHAPAVVGDRVRIWPAHVDPTVAYHERYVLVRGDEVVDEWPIDLRHW
jgi:D-serine deaminase-like pyridoxal phosphate-dependent protein